MRLLFMGDSQIGAGASFGSTPHGVGSRLHDQANMLKDIAQLAEVEAVDVVVHGGDIFERRNPSVAEIVTFQAFVDRVTKVAALKLVVGNHDCAGVNYPSVQRLFGGIEDGVEILAEPDVVYTNPPIAVLPWTPPARLVAALEGDRELLSERIAAALVEEAARLREECESPRAILVGHWSVTGASLPTGLPTDALAEPVLPVEELQAQGWDAILLSHIHTTGFLEIDGPPVLYSGSPWTCDWGEAEQPHGVWIVDTEEAPVFPRFVAVDDRKFVTVTVDLTADTYVDMGLSETEAVVAASATAYPLEGAVVRFKVRAAEEQARRIDWPKVTEALTGDGVLKVWGSNVEHVREERARVEGLDEGVGALAAVDIYLDRQDWDGFAKATVRQRAAEHLEQIG